MPNVGYLTVEDRKAGRVWIAKYRRADGRFTRKVLGPAWARDSGRRTARGATIWRAADGSCPDGHLTPNAAQAALDDLLAAERGKPAQRPAPADGIKTFGDATQAWLEYVSHEKQLAPSTLRRYRSIVDVHLLPEFGASTPLRRLTAERIEVFRGRLLAEDRQSRDRCGRSSGR
jgi:hypothetical protein